MKPKPVLSVIVPSRERADELKFSLDSLGLERNNIEALTWIDVDDPQLNKYHSHFDNNPHVRMYVKPRVGYIKFHDMVNFLAHEAVGDWSWLWNDDAYMESVEWYDKFISLASLANPKEEPIVYNLWGQGNPQNLFPIISKKYLEIFGRLSENCICDVWIKSVAQSSKIQQYVFGIKPKHRKYGQDENLKDLVDNTSRSIDELREKSRWLGARNTHVLRTISNDANFLSSWIQKSSDSNLRVGFIGLGKLGLPVALAIESRGKNVIGYDIDKNVYKYIQDKNIPYNEQHVNKLLQDTRIELANSIEGVVKKTDLIFCAIQTPHDPRFEGDRLLSENRADFDYSYLKKAIKEIVAVADNLNKKINLVVISTCIPGTFKKEIKKLLSPNVNYIYNPFFIAMGTVINDFYNPEFVLIGKDEGDVTPLVNFYKLTLNSPKFVITDITTAEGIKVFYNTFITAKTVLGNIYGEFAHKLGMNVDDIYEALSLATNRLLSPKYLKSGVGDGGGCHPRDNIALSHLAQKYNLSFNIFDSLMTAREKHMEWLANVALEESKSSKLPLVILGKAFKPETNLETGSPAILMANILRNMKAKLTHYGLDYPEKLPKAVYIIATQHSEYTTLLFPKGSIIIDPFRYIKGIEGVKLISIGGKI